MFPGHTHKIPKWYHAGNVIMPDVSKVHDRIERVATKTLERAHGGGLPCCRKRRK